MASLYQAVSDNKLRQIKLLLPKATEDEKKQALIKAISDNKIKAVAAILESGLDVNFSYRFGKTPLHLATELGYSKIVKLLLSKYANKEIRDLTGRAPLDIALNKKDEKVIMALEGALAATFTESYGKPDISQSVLNEKLRDYLTMLGVKEKKARDTFIMEQGNCNGWAFLYQYYMSMGKEKEFELILNYISKLDQATIHRLNNIYQHSENIRQDQEVFFRSYIDREDPALEEINQLKEHDEDKYKNAFDLLGKTINDLVWFQQDTKLITRIQQNERETQWQIAKDKKQQLVSIFSIKNEDIPAEHIDELLALAARWPGSWVDISVFPKNNPKISTGHTMSLYITSNGKFRYYDPNFKFLLPELDSIEMVSALIKNALNQEEVLSDFNMHRFYPINEQVPEGFIPPEGDLSKNYDAPIGKLLLSNSAKSNQLNFAKLILKSGGNQHVGSGNDQIALTESLKRAAILNGDNELENLLIQQGARPFEQRDCNKTARMALAAGNVKGLVNLLHRGFTFNINMTDDDGFTALHKAAMLGDLKTVEALLAADAKIELTCGTETALHMACAQGNVQVVEALLDKQANIEAQKGGLEEGRTPLHIAAKMGQTEVVEALLKRGANTEAKDIQGKTPLELAQENHYANVIAVLGVDAKSSQSRIPPIILGGKSLQSSTSENTNKIKELVEEDNTMKQQKTPQN